MPNFCFLAGLEVAKKFVVVGWVVEHVTTVSNSNASCFRVVLSWVELHWVLTIGIGLVWAPKSYCINYTLNTRYLYLCRSAHSTEAYNCLPCKLSFTEWRNLKRHNIEKHGNVRFPCSSCKFIARRNETLVRHLKTKHCSYEFARDLLDEILAFVVEDSDIIVAKLVDEVLDSVMLEMKTRQELLGLSPYEKIRNERIAQIQMEFERQFPNVWKELQEVRPGSKMPKKMKKPISFVTPQRKSSRIRDRACENEVAGSETEREMLEDDDNVGSLNGAQSGETEMAFDGLEYITAGSEGIALGRFACLACKKGFR